jgi:hypothetical protein
MSAAEPKTFNFKRFPAVLQNRHHTGPVVAQPLRHSDSIAGGFQLLPYLPGKQRGTHDEWQ